MRPRGRLLFAMGALAAAIAACTPLRVDGRDLDNSSWRALSVAGKVPPVGAEPTLRFDFATVEGNAGCNGYVGQRQARIDDGRLDLGEILATMGGCVDDSGHPTAGAEFEPVFLRVLGAADHVAFRGDLLVLSGPAGEIVLAPDRQAGSAGGGGSGAGLG